jgi:hypothetical protein
MSAARAQLLHGKQIGVSNAAARAAANDGNYLIAHRVWLKGFIDSKIDYNVFLCDESKALPIRDLFTITASIV